MNSHYTYLCVDAGCLIIPLAASFLPSIRFYAQWRYLAAASAITSAFFIAWDILFTRLGVWHFNSNYVLGPHFLNLPFEEVAFFICIPYACTFTFFCIRIFLKKNLNHNFFVLINLLLALAFAGIAVAWLPQLYTSVTFSLLAMLLIWLAVQRVTYMPAFYLSFILTLLPFFFSNGILTGAWTNEPVVSYNNRYNTGIRIYTIPVEDIFYGMLLQLVNIGLFMFLSARSRPTTKPAL